MKKIDFALVISVDHCNPNGDPLNGGRPRQDVRGYGEITDVCLKRKIRDRLQDLGEEILITPIERSYDGFYSTKERVRSKGLLNQYAKSKDQMKFVEEACKLWTDVRFFGMVFPFKEKGTGSVSIGIRGPVSIGMARSLSPVFIEEIGTTKSMNLNDPTDPDKSVYARDSTTLSARHIVETGVYVSHGSIFPELARHTGFSQEDVELLKEALKTLFENDASSRRPTGSMTAKLFWWEPESESIHVNSAKIFRSLHLNPMEDYPYYSYTADDIKGITLTVYDDAE